MGIKAVRSHMLSASHKAAVGRKQQVSIAHSCATSPPPPTIAEATAASATSSQATADLRVMLGATPTLRAEVLWCLNTVMKHQSINSKEGISDLFQAMFPDSEIAKKFACGKDKTGYTVRFGLAPYFKEQLSPSGES
ncbi:hypothetical protein KUCAC02_034015 [Chaenocephalus aceratus]|nr:hypothetical protein KUCAC02_034015 [Chaenocephalus aceratus]